MAIQTFGNGGIVVTGADTQLYRLLALKYALRSECRGMKMSRGVSAYAIVKAEFGLKGNKQKVLDQFTEILKGLQPAPEGQS